MKIVELQHLDSIKGNFGIADGTEYRANLASKQEAKPEDVVRAYEEELGRRVSSLAVVSDGFHLPSNAPVMVVSGGVLSQCPNPSQLCDVSKADHLISLLPHNSPAW